MADKIEQKFQKKGLKLTDQRRTIARVILESKEAYGESDHPDVEKVPAFQTPFHSNKGEPDWRGGLLA